MKIAYLFRGHSRTWKQCYSSFFNNVYSVAPGDIFIHTWDSVNSIYGSGWKNFNPLNETEKEISSRKINMKEIYDSYKPKYFIVEEDKIKDIKNIPNISDGTASRLGLKFMLEASKKLLDTILKNNYDFIFETRMDVCYTSTLDIKEFNSDKLMFSEVGSQHVMDFWCFGSVKNMKTKINYYNNIDEYWYNKDYHNFWYEGSLFNYLTDNNISCQISNLTFNVPRLF